MCACLSFPISQEYEEEEKGQEQGKGWRDKEGEGRREGLEWKGREETKADTIKLTPIWNVSVSWGLNILHYKSHLQTVNAFATSVSIEAYETGSISTHMLYLFGFT